MIMLDIKVNFSLFLVRIPHLVYGTSVMEWFQLSLL